MYLKSIEVHGFKSFANKLVFEFKGGITGIVGPNGSGKSNVADAVRWVLGEQSAKQLRGASMQDVIFSGTETRKKQSYAYVALTITNEDHKLAVPYEEVKVARRVYRSGESEYLLNGAACRLKDVQELFFDTGIGKEGYSIIGQGQVDKILSGKPEERRELFDEAAGIVKFKKRKKKTEKDLETERQNLMRVQDILSELEKQVGPLEAQSEKARAFLKLKDELKLLEINMFLADYENYGSELKETKENRENAAGESDMANQQFEAIKTQYGMIETAVEQFNAQVEENTTRVNEDKLLLSKYESDVNLAKQAIESIEQGKEFYGERIGVLEKSMADTKLEIEQYQANQKEAFAELANMKSVEALCQEEVESKAAEIVSIETTSSEKNQEIYENHDALSNITAEQQKCEAMLEQNNIRKTELTQRILTNKSVVDSKVKAMEQEEIKLDSICGELEKAVTEKEKLNGQLQHFVEEERSLRSDLQEKQKRFHMETSKLSSLKNLMERYEGYGQSIRRVMEQKETHKGIVGVVADIIKVDPQYSVAVETALGGSIQNIVTEDESTAKEMIGFLKKNRYGRATFLPLTTVSASAGRINEQVLQETGVIGVVSSLVDKNPKFTGLIEYLLGRFVLVDTIDHGLALNKKFHHSLRIVTLEGDLLNPGGSMSGGAYKNQSNLLGRQSEMDQLQKNIEESEMQINEINLKIQSMELKKKEIQTAMETGEEHLKALEIQENTAQITYNQAVREKEEKEREYKMIVEEGKELENQKVLLLQAKSDIEARYSQSQNSTKDNRELLEQLAAQLELARNDEKESQEKLAKIRLDIAAFQQKNEYILENLNRLEVALGEFEEEHFSYVEDSERSEERVIDKKSEIEEINALILKIKENIEKTEEAIHVDREQRDSLMKQQKDFFEKRDSLMMHISRLDKELFRLDERIQKIEEQLSRQVDYMWNEYEMTYIAAGEYKMTEEMSYTSMKNQIGQLKSSIRSLGDVNVNSIEDFKSVSERYYSLKTQHDDLVESEVLLRQIIEELDVEMRKQFREKFDLIREQFNIVFRELFGGGKGTLEIIEEDDVDILEAGIRIIAQPPGKKLVNMMQLSGGERALTAIALLFSIQNLKPSPFCLLDEIEAALDDSNVRRYAKYLHKLTKTTQFIVITHRQGTMEAADALYGITMQEKGVSTLVSVKFIEDQIEK